MIVRSASARYVGLGKEGKGKNMLGVILMQVRDELRGVKRDRSYYVDLTQRAAKKYGGTK